MRTYQPHQAIVMEANASSPTGAPKLRKRHHQKCSDPATRRLLIQQGDADMARDLGADQIDALQGKPGSKSMTLPPPNRTTAFNTGNKDNLLIVILRSGRLAGWSITTQHHQKSLKRTIFTIKVSPVGFPEHSKKHRLP